MILSQVISRKMTLSKKASDFFRIYISGIENRPYLIINVAFAGVILLVLAYSGIFSPDKNNYPVICIHEKLTGLPCFSCGLSHSFSLIIRGRFTEAYQWNIYGMRVFLFFVSQLSMRIFFSLNYIRNKDYAQQIINYDIIGSVIIFLIAFYPFFRQLFLSLFTFV
jgi:hypothetical protein